MKKYLELLLFTLPLSAFSHQFIVFGDSLSDNGNLPESPNVYWHADKPPTLDNMVPQWYVPVSNPVDTATPGQWPVLNNAYLQSQPTINGSPRRYRSLIWPQFLSSAEKTTVVPNQLLKKRFIPNTLSYNYAWAYAISGKDCTNTYYQSIEPCTSKSITMARDRYIANPSEENYRALEIPGLYKQVELFFVDQLKHRVTVTKESTYFIWIGGNDLIIAASALLNKYNPLPFLRYFFGITSKHIIENTAILIHYLPESKRPAQIYVLTLFNPALTPGFHAHTFLSILGDVAVRVANAWIRWDAMIFNLFSKTKIIVLPVDEWYRAATKNPVFLDHIGDACQLSADYTQANYVPKENCAGYLFWNSVHPATKMQEITADNVWKAINT